MKISLTFGEILTKYNWKKFCEIRKYDTAILTKGYKDVMEYVTLTEEEAKQIGIKFIERKLNE